MKGIKALELCTASGWTETPQSVLFLTVDLEYRSHQKAINKLANWLRITASLEVHTFITISLVLFVFNQNANAILRWGKTLKRTSVTGPSLVPRSRPISSEVNWNLDKKASATCARISSL